MLRLVASGFSAPEIGEKLFISPKTVDTYKQRVNEKLGLAHRARRHLLIAAIAGGGWWLFRHRLQVVNALPVGLRDAVFGMRYGYRVERDVMIPMPDGVRLATNLYFPKGFDPDGPAKLPVVLIRLPYDKNRHPGWLAPARSQQHRRR